MGMMYSFPMSNFDLGDYWIGRPLDTARRGLAFHFPKRTIRSISSSELFKLDKMPPNPDHIVIIYDPYDEITEYIITGLAF
jgi:hypothetical protein